MESNTCRSPARSSHDRAERVYPNESFIRLKDEVAAGRSRWRVLTVYEKFEHGVILLLTGVIAIVILAALWSLILKVLLSLVLSESLDPTDAVFQSVFGMIFTVIIALEFKGPFLLVA